MSGIAYRPPSENLAIFDPSVFLAQDQPLTYDVIANNFLQFPNGQGTETIPSLIVPGTSTLGVTNASTLNLSDTLNIANGLNTSTFDMNASNNLTINNNVAGGNMFFNIKDPTLNQVCNTVSISKTNGLNSGCSVLNNLPTTTANFVCFTASSASTTTALQLCVSPNGGTYNNLVASNDPFIVGTGAGSNLGVLTLTTWSSSRLGIRINSNSINSVEVAGALIQLNATTTGGLTSTTPQPASTDSSTKVPTTAWVQSAIAQAALPAPFFQFSGVYVGNQSLTPPVRVSTIQFNFTGSSWTNNSYFTIAVKFSSMYYNNSTNATSSDYQNISFTCDIYPFRCPGNTTANGAYGIGQNGNTPSNMPSFNNSIYDGTAYGSTYVFPVNATYSPYGRWFYSQGYAYNPSGSTLSSPQPIQPYIVSGTADKTGMGIGIWNYLPQTGFSQYTTMSIQLVNRGMLPITLTTTGLPTGAIVNQSGW
jgi:hypothetical protein